jgi:hypothetical protein
LPKRISYKRQIQASAVFESAIRETEEPQTHALDRAVTGISSEDYTEIKLRTLNSLILNDFRSYCRVDFVDYEEKSAEELYALEFLNRSSPSGLPPPRLNLNINVTVIFLRWQ